MQVGLIQKKTCTQSSSSRLAMSSKNDGKQETIKNLVMLRYQLMDARLDEMQLQKAIRLSELPLPGMIRAVYQRIGSKPQAESVGMKRGRPRADDEEQYGEKKVKVSYLDCDMQKDITKWTKLELHAYLCHHSLKKKNW